jgi:hypothetical protein
MSKDKEEKQIREVVLSLSVTVAPLPNGRLKRREPAAFYWTFATSQTAVGCCSEMRTC